MKKIILGLIVLILVSCSNEKKILEDELTQKNGLRYYEGELYSGKVIDITKKGIKLVEGYYKDGKRDGKWLSWSENGKIINGEENYKDGKLDGIQIHYYENGELLRKWRCENGKEVEEIFYDGL